jgi:hypothetical protein
MSDPTSTKFDLAPLTAELQATLLDELETILDTADEAVNTVLPQVMPVLIEAARSGDVAMQRECMLQLRLAWETQRITTAKSTWRVLKSVTNVALKALSSGFALARQAAGVPVLLLALAVGVGCAHHADVSGPVARDAIATVGTRIEAYFTANGDPTWAPEYFATKQELAALTGATAVEPLEYVEAQKALPAIERLCAWHDSLVTNDLTLSDVRRTAYLRTTRMLRDTFRLAAEAD